MALTFAQQLLRAELTVCCEEECKTIRDVYNEIQKRHDENPGLNYWCHADFKIPLKTFVEWYNNKQQIEKYKVKESQAHIVLDNLYDSD